MFIIYQDKSKRNQCWRWRFVERHKPLADGILAKSEEPFAFRRNCERSVKVIQSGGWVKKTFVSSKTDKIYWVIKAKNGRVLGMSPKGYDSMTLLDKDWKVFKRKFKKALVVENE